MYRKSSFWITSGIFPSLLSTCNLDRFTHTQTGNTETKSDEVSRTRCMAYTSCCHFWIHFNSDLLADKNPMRLRKTHNGHFLQLWPRLKTNFLSHITNIDLLYIKKRKYGGKEQNPEKQNKKTEGKKKTPKEQKILNKFFKRRKMGKIPKFYGKIPFFWL